MSIIDGRTVQRFSSGSSTASFASGGLTTVPVRYNVSNGSAGISSYGEKGWYNPQTGVLTTDAWGNNVVSIGLGQGQAIAGSIVPDDGGSGRVLAREEFMIAFGQTSLTNSPMQPAVGDTLNVLIQPILNTLNFPDFQAGRIVHISNASLESYGSYVIEVGIDAMEDQSTATSLVLRRRDLSSMPMMSRTADQVEVPAGTTIPSGSIVTGRSTLGPPPEGATFAEVVFQTDASIPLDAIILRDTNYLFWHSTRVLGMSIGPSNLLGRHYAENFVDSNEVRLSCTGGAFSECSLAEFLGYTAGDKAVMANVLWYDGLM